MNNFLDLNSLGKQEDLLLESPKEKDNMRINLASSIILDFTWLVIIVVVNPDKFRMICITRDGTSAVTVALFLRHNYNISIPNNWDKSLQKQFWNSSSLFINILHLIQKNKIEDKKLSKMLSYVSINKYQMCIQWVATNNF